MQCRIEHIPNNSGVEYWCLTHKTKATKKENKFPVECDCKYKERYNEIVEMNHEDIKSIQIIYPNLNESTNVSLYINEKEFLGILKIKNSIIDLKDYGGMLLSKLNNIILETSECPVCKGKHTDNGQFAYTPHSKHLCIYCGRFYDVEKANIGNELALYFDFPDIHLEENIVSINEKCKLSYDLSTGTLLINNYSCNTVEKEGEKIELITFLNEMLKEEY